MQIQCSNCGAIQRFKYTVANVNNLIAFGWNSCGSALYCPECVKTWEERNHENCCRLAGRNNTIRVIDEQAER